MVAAVLFIALVVTLVLNMPVGIAIGVSSLCAILADGRISSLYIVQQLVTSADSFPLMAIPLFILAGELMGAGGVSKRLLNVCNVFLGRFTGGLATVTIVLCMFFAAVSGSGPATVAAIGSMVIPTMLDKGYSKSFTLALIATAGSIGVIIPPSIPMVIYGVSTSTSISSLFMAGFLPGILIGFSLIVVSYLYCKKQGWKGDERKYTAKEKLAAIWDAKWALLNPIIILGGIYAGIFTPTEAAAVAAVYAFICGAFIYREFNIKEMFATIGNACNTTGTTMVIIGCATAFTKILTIEKIPGAITNGIINFTDNKILILLLINVLLLIVPCAEVTFRTDAAKESIAEMTKAYPEMLVGAGTVLNTDQVDAAVEAGAKFIVSPGLNPDTVEYCVKKGIPILPGCSSPSDIEQAIKYGLNVVKFFPAEAAGGLKAIKAMAAPYSQIRFMPTGGINPSNVSDYLAEDKILACGGTWMVPAAEIEAGNFDKIRELTEEAVRSMLGFRLAHVGINCENESEAHLVAGAFDTMFGFAPNENPSSIFSAGYVETMKKPYLGTKGHIAIATYSVELAKAYLERKGVKFNEDSTVYRPDGKIQAVYMAEEVGGFAIHLVRKPKEA